MLRDHQPTKFCAFTLQALGHVLRLRTYRVVGIGAPSNRVVGIGAPSFDARCVGVATAVYAQNRPTIRISILTARFMFFLLGAGPPGAETLTMCEALYKLLSSGRAPGFF